MINGEGKSNAGKINQDDAHRPIVVWLIFFTPLFGLLEYQVAKKRRRSFL